jgi:type III secretion protein R
MIGLIQTTGASDPSSNLVMWVGVLAALALLPFALAMVSSFAKLLIVGSILRQALGTPQIPPNTVITGLALILTIHIMSPVAIQGYARWETASAALQQTAGDRKLRPDEQLVLLGDAVRPTLRGFLEKHASESNVQLFHDLRAKLWQSTPETRRFESDQDLELATILVPAFVLTELTEAFQIGFLIFIPFLIIDLTVSNLLLAMNMSMLSPITISLPLKLLLFVVIDGWTIILRGLVDGYA